jgi:hypothetical protein
MDEVGQALALPACGQLAEPMFAGHDGAVVLDRMDLKRAADQFPPDPATDVLPLMPVL